MTGSVVWWNDDEGWGALSSDAVPSEVFAHFSEVQMEGYRVLRSGQDVVFEVEHFPAGVDGYVYRAWKIRVPAS
ncbi:cold-shock protein [Subtercola boreus]|uniref:cold-shock protein n=1 Tax=Subtercola boreus TaxID=120213 RepID=UPI0015599EBE